MSLQIPVQKDIGEYEEKIVGKLSFRTLVCVAGGFGSAILVAAMCHFWIGIEVADAALPVMCASIPFWLAGFWRLLYACPAAPFLEKPEAGKPTRRARRAAKRKGAEGHEPSRQEDI